MSQITAGFPATGNSNTNQQAGEHDPQAPQISVGFALYNGCTLLDFAGATQIFNFAGYQTLWLAEACDSITTTRGLKVLPHKTFAHVLAEGQSFDILFVPGGGEDVAKIMLDADFLDFLRKTAARSRWVGSVCTGAFPLAAAGLLQGCTATTYWSQLENLALFPGITVPEGYPRSVIDEKQHRFSGGGVSSSIDLALELLQRLSGVKDRQTTQLAVQYAPKPPLPPSGDPNSAPADITKNLLNNQHEFIEVMQQATLTVLGKS